jgi:hypothetical protein
VERSTTGLLVVVVVALVVLGLGAGSRASADTIIANGLVNTLNGETVSGNLYVLSAGPTTTVNMNGGAVTGSIWDQNGSAVNVSGVDIASQLIVSNHSTGTMSGGSVGALRANTGSTLDFNGGTLLSDALVDTDSTINVLGGSISGTTLTSYSASVLNIYGWDFKRDGVDLPYGSIVASDDFMRGFSGTLADGSAFDNLNLQGSIERGGQIYLLRPTAVPAPSAGWAGLVLIGGIGARKRLRRHRGSLA